MHFFKYSTRCIASYLFLIQPLKDLSETYELNIFKLNFPQHVNTPEHSDDVGEAPKTKTGPQNMSVKSNKTFYG